MSIFDLFKKIEKENQVSFGAPEWLIVGLGNPGDKYETTRHNAGFLAMDVLASRFNIKISRMKFSALIGQGTIAGKNTVLMKPQKFMNLSGECVRDAAKFYNLAMDRVIVMYDDVSLEPGRIRVRAKGSAGGHNGIKNIIAQCGSDAFPRVKIGVGAKPHPDYDMADWVLSNFSKDEQAALTPALDNAASAAVAVMTDGVAGASNRFNGAGA